jgi:sulfhydrogenase subunit beta (sulfur reductase)
LKKADLPKFILLLQKKFEVIAPVRKGKIDVFDTIKSFDEINLNCTNTIYPPKQYFFPDKEELFSYDKNKIEVNFDNKRRAIFGIRTCDVNGLVVMDMLFITDPYYRERRKNNLIIAMNCKVGGVNCLCEAVGWDKLEKGFDLAFTEESNGYIVEVGSEKGNKLIDKKLFKPTNKKPETKTICRKTIDPAKIKKLKTSFHHHVWEKEAKRCLSCGACTITCPTCACFDVKDIPTLDIKKGSRIRTDASCQLKDFTKVAGGHVFRDERSKRLKHRIYHKFDYFMEEHKHYMCTGCGRCITNCPTFIDMTKIFKKL